MDLTRIGDFHDDLNMLFFYLDLAWPGDIPGELNNLVLDLDLIGVWELLNNPTFVCLCGVDT